MTSDIDEKLLGAQAEQPDGGSPPPAAVSGSGDVWVRDIPITEIRVGDYVQAWVNCGKSALHARTTWRGEVSEILGNVIRFKVRWRKPPFATTRAAVIKAWGYRQNT